MALPDDTLPRDDASAAAVADAVIKALQAEIALLRSENEALIPIALMTDRFPERQSMCFTQRPSPFGPVNSQGAWYKGAAGRIGAPPRAEQQQQRQATVQRRAEEAATG